MKFCTRCVLPETFPGINFNEDGICNYCVNTPTPDDDKKNYYKARLDELIDGVKGKGEYDIILAFSGGKDSTYTMKILIEEYNVRILALTFDNGFLSPVSRDNIIKVCDNLGATSLIVRPPFNLMSRAFTLSAADDIYSTKTLDRASSICTTCIGMVKAQVLKTAIQKKIPLAAWGWSPGQAPISSAIMQNNPRLQVMNNRMVRDLFLKKAGNDYIPYFLSDDDCAIDSEKWPINIHPLAFYPYDENNILDSIAKLGWQKPVDTDPNSTNCVINALANYLHRKRYNFHPYAWEIAGIVRSGSMSRTEGLEKTTVDESMEMVEYAAKKINYVVS